MKDGKVKVSVARLCYGEYEHARVGSWLAKTMYWLVNQRERVHGIEEWVVNKTAPVSAARNLAAMTARQGECDLLVMVDHDMLPDVVQGAPPFIEVAFGFLYDNLIADRAPAWVAAPACAEDGRVCVHKLVEAADGSRHLLMMLPEETLGKRGLERVPGTGAGLVMYDLRCLDGMEEPWFESVYADANQTVLHAGEDIHFTAKLTEAGLPVLVAWDCWAGHDKRRPLGKPEARLPQRKIILSGG